MKNADISVAARILAQFPDRLSDAQKVPARGWVPSPYLPYISATSPLYLPYILKDCITEAIATIVWQALSSRSSWSGWKSICSTPKGW